MNFILRYYKFYIYFIIFFFLSSCSNIVVTELNKDLRRIDIMNLKEGIVLKSYHQKFSPELNKWLKADCKKTANSFSKTYSSLLNESEKSELIINNCKFANNSVSKISISKFENNKNNNYQENNFLNQENLYQSESQNDREEDSNNEDNQEEENNIPPKLIENRR